MEGTAVGFVSVTSQVTVDFLTTNYDLGAFDDLRGAVGEGDDDCCVISIGLYVLAEEVS